MSQDTLFLVIDPDNGKTFMMKNLSEQQLVALEDAEYTVISPAGNVWRVNGSWENIPYGHLAQAGQVVTVL